MRFVLLSIVLLCAVPRPSWPQQQWLATNKDGSAVWMQSGWYQTGDDAEGTGENFVYRFDGSAWMRSLRSGPGGAQRSGLAVSEDGRVISWQRSPACFRCFQPPTTEWTGLDKPVLISRAQLVFSRNARFALSPNFANISGFEWQDLETGRVWKAPEAPALLFSNFGPASIADDGSVAALLDGAFVHWRPGSPARPVADRLPYQWQLSADARRVWGFFARAAGERGELVWIDVESGEQIVLAREGAEWVRMSGDGGRLLFPSPGGLTLLCWDAVQRETRVAIEAAGRLYDAALSSDGRVAWVRTAGNRLLRLDLESGRTEVLFEGLPDTAWSDYLGVPGSALEISFNGADANDLEVRFDGAALPVAGRTESSVTLQIPWELTPPQQITDGASYLVTARRSGNPFELRGTVPVFFRGPLPMLALNTPRGEDRLIKAVQPDFGSLVTRVNPARAGETIHLYLYGLGPLDRPVATGERGPADPPARPVAGVACYILGLSDSSKAVGLHLPFVAFAPGLIGVYQVDATIPDAWPSGLNRIRCEAGGRSGEGFVPIG